MVESCIARFRWRSVPHDDLAQVARLGLVSAADRFDPDLGCPFSAFARRTIDGELKRYLRDRTWMVRPPRHHQELFLRVCSAEERLTQAIGRAPTVAEIAIAVDASEDHVIEALEASQSRRAHCIDDPWAATRASSSDVGFDRVEGRMIMRELLAELRDDERLVLRRQYFDNCTQAEVARELGRSQSYVSRLTDATLRKLRARLDD